MKELNDILDADYSCMLIAPTGWGKTTLLIDLIQKSDKKWVYLSPLRALCDEFSQRAIVIEDSHCPKTQKDLLKVDKDFKLITITPELCSDELIFEEDVIWVFDEFHLFYYWGESFRRKIIDLFEVLVSFNRKYLLLSATVDDEVFKYWSEFNHDKICINLGNQMIKKEPLKRYYYQDEFSRQLSFIKGENPTLVFFKYRKEVKSAEVYLKALGFKVVSGLGGESHLFNQRIKDNPDVDFILGTSALSHGVNLPKISNILLTFKIGNLDMWTQMVGRAGRRGENFRLYTKDHYRLNGLQLIKTLINSYLKKYKLRIQSGIDELRRFDYSQS